MKVPGEIEEPVSRETLLVLHAEDSDDCAVLDLSELTVVPRDHCGGGLLYQAYISTLGELAAVVERKDQTLSYFGFDATQVRQLARALNGRGIDRIVPIGQALSFNRYWDGYDLLRSFTRVVSLQ